MDVGLRLSARARDVTLDLDRGKPGGGGFFYSGLCIRFDHSLTPGSLLDADGRTAPDAIYGSRSRWCGYACRHGEDGGVYGITVIDHPDNPRHPTTWWVRNRANYALLHPSVCYYEPLQIAEGQSLLLRYRVVLHKGFVSPDLIRDVDWDVRLAGPDLQAVGEPTAVPPSMF